MTQEQLTTMKRYQRLGLWIFAGVSLVLFVIYKTKYARVSFVLQYMDVFGAQPDVKTCKHLLKNSKELVAPVREFVNTTYGDTGVPSWREVTRDCFVYSAYWDEKNHEVKVIALSRNLGADDLKCSLWYFSAKEPSAGQLVTKIKHAGLHSAAVILSCKNSIETDVPYGISLYDGHDKSDSHTIVPVLSSRSSGVLSTKVSACVEGLSQKMTLGTMLIEFLEYHLQIGIGYFIFYDEGMHPVFRNILQVHAAKAGFSFEILQWNLPYDLANLSRIAFQEDCQYRSLMSSLHFFKLNINQFVVPIGQTLEDIIHFTSPQTKVLFNVKLFCSEFESDIVAKTLGFPFVTLKKTKYINATKSTEILYSKASITLPRVVKGSQSVPPSMVAGDIHVHCPCGKLVVPSGKQVAYQSDTSMLRMKSIYFKSALYQAYVDRIQKISF